MEDDAMMRRDSESPAHNGEPRTIFIACAALGREVKAIIKKHGWQADFEAIDARLHLRPQLIGPAVEERLQRVDGEYERKVVVYGHCGANDLDGILDKHGAVRPRGPHCYEMYGGADFAREMEAVPGTFILVDYLIHAWETFVVKGLRMDEFPELKEMMFRNYERVLYYSQEEDEALLARAEQIAAWLALPLEVTHVGYGDLERRLVAIMEGREQP